MNLSIRTKLLAGFSVILLLLVFLAFFMTDKLSESNDRLKSIVEISTKKTSLSKDLLLEVLQATKDEKNIILETNNMNLYITRLRETLARIDKKTPELRDLMDKKGIKDIEEFTTKWNSYKISLDEIIKFSQKNENEKAFEISVTEGRNTRDIAFSIIERIIERNEKITQEYLVSNDKIYLSSLNTIITLVIIGLLISVLFIYWIVQSIGKRISFIAQEAEKISTREFTHTKLVDNTSDELKPIFKSLESINESFREVTHSANIVASGDYEVSFNPKSEKDSLGNALKKMTVSLRETTTENKKHNWLTNGQNQLNEKLRGDQSTEILANDIIMFLSHYINANIGALYLYEEESNTLSLSGEYAFSSNDIHQKSFKWNEGLVGQSATEQKTIILSHLDEHNIRISSSFIDTKPSHIIISPFHFEGHTLGVIELGKIAPFSDAEKEFVEASMENIAISFNSALARKRIQQLLEETQAQSEELQYQQEELKQMNEELEEQTQNLKQQQDDLQMTNEELEEQTHALEIKNKEIETARLDIEKKTHQLEISSKYKSEFLANMSHELRTPLNSLLILSKDLADNKNKNLSEDQVESAEIINKSGYDLLSLINEVLDLSKIEAGKMTLNIERLTLTELSKSIKRNFKHQTDQKGLALNISIAQDLPESIRTDIQRLDQIIKNLLSNAIKFTDQGSIDVELKLYNKDKLNITVQDTGVGIAPEKQMAIFEAFHQGDGSTSRKYGGTGLGLSISRELTKLLGGEIELNSKIGEGSTFSIIIPIELKENEQTNLRSTYKEGTNKTTVFEKDKSYINYPSIEDDRDIIQNTDKILLVIEDDLKFAKILFKQSHSKGFKCLSAATGEDGLILAEKFKPQAIILDMDLPGMDGHKVLSELKNNPAIRHIPVHIISAKERSMDTIKEGAVEYITKPIDKSKLEEAFNRIENFINRKMKNLLIVEDDSNSRKAIKKLIGNGDVKCLEAQSGEEALKLFKENFIDCIVLDLGLPDINGLELIYQLEKIKDQIPPIIVYTGRELTKEENNELQKYTETIIIKGIKSEERLLDETALFLHRTISELPESKQKIIIDLYDKENIFHDKKILVVDDDMRNVFALSKILKERRMTVLKAENGRIALDVLNKTPDINMVLMDIMMPEMDGYEAMQKIRSQDRFKAMPIIALTAKAMKDDKQKCIDAGANDYISKPIDLDRLLSLMRVWLSK